MEALGEANDVFDPRLQAVDNEICVTGTRQRVFEVIFSRRCRVSDRLGARTALIIPRIVDGLVRIQPGLKARQADEGFEDRTRSVVFLRRPVSLRAQWFLAAPGDLARGKSVDGVVRIDRGLG